MHARLDHGRVSLLTRTGLDWTHKYPSIAAALSPLRALVVEVKYLTWTDDNLLRQVVYEGQREDKDPTDVQRRVPNQASSGGGRSL